MSSRAPAPRPSIRLAAAAAVSVLLALSACADDPDEGADQPSTTLAPPPEVAPADDGDEPVELTLVEVGLGLTEPIAMVPVPGSDQLLVAERAGVIHQVTASGDRLDTVGEVIDLRGRVGETSGERGLLGIAVHPDGDRLYASYTRADDGASQLDEYELDVDQDGQLRAEASTRRELLLVEQPFANHNGGHIVFGPDGQLLLGLGDGGSGGDPEGNAQNPETLLGKLVAIDVDADEPDPQIWSTGLRNPWRFSFDRSTGDLWVADVGQNRYEEVNRVTAADGAGRNANFGWDLFEGTEPFEDASYELDEVPGPFVEPVFTYGRDAGCSITGGVVYRGEEIPSIDGWYLYSDYCAGGVRALSDDGAGGLRASQLVEGLSNVVAFGEDRDGEVYVLTLSEGVHRLTTR